MILSAVQHHRAGRLDTAEELYRSALRLDPGHVLATHHLGIVAFQTGRLEDAARLFRRTISLKPDYPEAYRNLGALLRAQGRGGEAIIYYEQAALLNPRDPDLHGDMGALLRDLGRVDEAAAEYRRAIALRPDFAEAHNDLGSLLRDRGDLAGALECYRRATGCRPQLSEASYNLGLTLDALERLDEARDAYRAAIRARPDFVEAHINLGAALQRSGRLAEAISEYREALRHAPDHPTALTNLGAALDDTGQSIDALEAHDHALAVAPGFALAHVNRGATLAHLERDAEAVEAYREAIRHDPGNAEAHGNLGLALTNLGRTAEAVQAHRQAVALAPDNPKHHHWLGMALLLTGAMTEGWAEHEWRRKLPGFQRDLPKPAWTGEALGGKTILLHAEQGYGDTLHFVRYAPLVAATGGRVVLWVPDPLIRLLATVPGVAEAVSDRPPASAFDVHLPRMSLPHAFGATLDTISAPIPYLSPDGEAVAAWGKRVARLAGLKIGLVWAGNPGYPEKREYRIDRRRSLRLEQLAPLAEIDGITFVSLQKGDAAGQATAPPAGLRLVDWMDEVTDFADTAALVANLDLVISVDTSVAHLAGAMGKPVWILSRFDGCWRWLENRDDSPWYPTARLFRQPAPGQWEPVLIKVADALRKQVAAP